MSHPLIDGLATSADILIHNFDVALDRALVIRLSEDQRRKASFLDDRILGAGVEGGWAQWAQIEPAARRAPAGDPAFIFHVGHCGSTLISKLIEEATGVRSLREPNGLRTLATIAGDVAEDASLWSAEVFRDRLALYLNIAAAGRSCVIKATSWCGALADHTSGRALFCYSRPEAFIATMLGGANNPTDLKLNAAMRLKRLRALCGARALCALSALSPGELAGLGWACETATIAGAMSRDAGRFHPVEFDEFLAAPEQTLTRAIAHLSIDGERARLAAALSGPLMRTYSKDASFDYSPDDRRQLLGEYKAAHGAEIAKGRAWIDTLAKTEPAVEAALSRFGA
ncbi:MAG: hypothetical protein KDD85_08205 [Parvularculaceae bacterium]|nr:hypothetical protein [Parvularculaceae bacterium]